MLRAAVAEDEQPGALGVLASVVLGAADTEELLECEKKLLGAASMKLLMWMLETEVGR